MVKQHNQVYHHSRAEGLLNPLRGLVHHPKSLLTKYLRPDDQVLDLGCGPGFFSLRIAQMLNPEGHVTAVDIQPEMLKKLEEQIHARGLGDKITMHLQASPETIGLEGEFDFIMAFYMLHEVVERINYLSQVRALLPPSGLFLLVEPWFVVTPEEFMHEINQAEQQGLSPVNRQNIFMSHAMYFSPS